MNKKVTMKTIAEMAGVSVAAVSLALNPNTGNRVSEEKREHIMSICKNLNYQPDIFAKALKTRKTNQILLAVPSLSNPFLYQMFSGAKSVLEKENYNTIVYENGNGQNSNDEIRDALRRLISSGVDGIIVHSVWGDRLEDFIPQGMPMVHVDKDPSVRPGVGFNIGHAVELITQHFIDQGVKEIGYIGSTQKNYTFTQRIQSFEQTMKKNGLEVNADWIIETTENFEGALKAYDIFKKWSSKPRAMVVFTDVVAQVFHQRLVQERYKIPDDIAIAGIDDIEFSSLLSPALTSVKLPAYEAGKYAAELLLRSLAGEDVKNRYIELPVTLHCRASSQIE